MTEQTIAAGQETARIDEEDIRLATGFADIFTAIMLVVGLSAVFALMPGALGGLATMAAAVALAPALVQRRRFAASAIILSLAVAGGALALTSFAGVGAFLFCAIAVAAYGFVFDIPIAKALGWVAAVATVALIGIDATEIATFRALFAGFTLFGIAMWYDSSDRLRKTRRSDVAFWLHLASAPLIVHGVFTLVGVNPFFGVATVFGAVAGAEQFGPALVLPIFAVLTIVALVVDRRPILVSSISYLFAAVGNLLNVIEPTRDGSATFLKTALAPGIIGLAILLLAAGWTPLRRWLIGLFPDAVTRWVPPASPYAPPRETFAELPRQETEPLRLVLGFNDLFVAMGCVALFLSSITMGAYFSYIALAEAENMWSSYFWRSPHLWYPVILPALTIWGAAEYFVRGRRMAWPAVTLATQFAIVAAMAGLLLAVLMGLDTLFSSSFVLGSRASIPPPLAPGQIVGLIVVGVAVGVAANLAFWWRHRVPISFALAVSALIPLLFIDQLAFAWSAGPSADLPDSWPWRLVGGGLATFALAMAWDRSDVGRTTQRADTAFWLHLLASLLVIPALYSLAMRVDGGWMLVVGGYVALVLVAVVIDRRAPLAVGMPFVIAALGETLGGGIVTLGVAVALLALALKWDQARALILGKREVPAA